MKRKHFTLAVTSILLLTVSVYLTACDKQEAKQTTQPEPPTTSPVIIDGDIMTISNGSDKATITRQPTGYTASYGEFSVNFHNMRYQSGLVTELGFTEWTDSDSLVINIEILGYRHKLETYTRFNSNGIQTLSLETIDSATPEQEQQLMEFLMRPTINSVMENPDSEILTTFLGEYAQDIDVAISSPDKRPAWGDVLCNAATVCVATKCNFGGPILNRVCGACTSMAFACSIMDMMGWW